MMASRFLNSNDVRKEIVFMSDSDEFSSDEEDHLSIPEVSDSDDEPNNLELSFDLSNDHSQPEILQKSGFNSVPEEFVKQNQNSTIPFIDSTIIEELVN